MRQDQKIEVLVKTENFAEILYKPYYTYMLTVRDLEYLKSSGYRYVEKLTYYETTDEFKIIVESINKTRRSDERY